MILHMTDAAYDRIAAYWPLLSPPGDYAPEAARVRDVLATFGPVVGSDESDVPLPQRPSILELGAGGGHTLFHLAEGFDCTGVDLSYSMLENARDLVPAANFLRGDMRSVRLRQHFDCVLLHDSVDYMLTPEDALQAVKTAAAHLKPGGIAIVAPTYLTESFTDHAVATDANSNGKIEVAFTSTVRRESQTASTFELVMLIIARENGQLTVNEDRHLCGLFSREMWCEFLDEAEFEVYLDGDSPVDEFDNELAQTPEEGVEVPWFVGIKR